MTFITSASLASKSALAAKTEKHLEQLIEMPAARPNRGNKVKVYCRVNARALQMWLCVITVAILLMLACICLMLVMLPKLNLSNSQYHGFCTIPITDVPENSKYYGNKKVPLRWTSNPDVQVFSTVREDVADDFINTLREQFDIGETVEKISVMDNGRQVNFIHDFEVNLTGIVDSDRCFIMDLDPQVVLTPEVLVLSIVDDAKFDISRVRSTLRAVLPALPTFEQQSEATREWQLKCHTKPTYRLKKANGLIIRKRAVDAPSHDYIHFAGRQVQEIEISNLADLLQHEQDNTLA